MAKDKKSFLLYADLIHTVKQLPNNKAGELFKHVLSYVNDENPETDDVLIKVAFEPIKQFLKRDLEKYEKIVKRNAENGKKGGRPKKAKEPTGLNSNPTEPPKADSDSDSDSGSDEKEIIEGNGKSVTPQITSNIVFSPEITNLLVRVKGLFDPKLIDTKAKCEKWMNTVRLLNEKDGHSFEEIEDVVTFGRTDNFWGSNFLSIQSLRSKRKGDDVMKYDKIFAQMKSEAGNGAQKFSPNKLGTTSAIGKSGISRFKAKKLG